LAPRSHEHWITTADGRLFAKSWHPAAAAETAPIVLLHDSLGSVELWRDFPERLAQVTGRTVVAYDRLGFGRSDPYPGTLPLDFIEREAHGAFAAVREQLDLACFVAFGHSVGGGMAAHCAAAYPDQCRALITESAQAFVEDRTLAGIRAARQAFAEPDQFERLRKYHGDKAAWVLNAWIDTWLSDAFRAWSLDDVLPQVRCPLLAIHGDRDEYGSTHHPERLVRGASGPSRLALLPGCGHVPHREAQPQVLDAVAAFLATAG